ncbi:MAG: FkbM family methyltransferase [Marinilabiliaceae bacterium]|nr:FkbM family methyltransferase [Marinilabiliaceae bacterium]
MSYKNQLAYFYKIFKRKEFWISRELRCKIVWLGTDNAGFYVVPHLLNEKSIVYSFGVGENISFDKDIIKHFSCSVFAFDPTPKSIKFVERNVSDIENFIFFPFGLYNKDCHIDFYLPQNPNFVSGSTYKEDTLKEKISVPVKQISTIIKDLGHTQIDLIKMDIEGTEYDVIDDILGLDYHVPQIAIELHHRFKNIGIAKSKDLLRKMKNAGYKIAAISDTHEEYTFVKL